MTIMGMAASQARFLGLTARKSNVEYQGQQINQQRTALSNESANLYNRMLELTVPTPPSTNDFYETVYTLDGSQESYATSDYKLSNVVKTYAQENQYKVTLSYKEEKLQGTNDLYYAQYATAEEYKESEDGETFKKYSLSYTTKATSGSSFITKMTYDEGDTEPFVTDETGKKTFSTTENQVYKLDATSKDKVTGYDAWYSSLTEEEKASADTASYFFRIKGKDYFITQNQLDILTKTRPEGNTEPYNASVAIGSSYTYYKERTTDVIAELEKSSNGRYSSISISDNDDYPVTLKGKTYSISITQEMNQQAYDDAFNDYEYQKQQYEKSISDINAQTEVIQNQDQQLELRLQQLNTEQDAISTEMDAVSKVIEDNVEKTFKIFA